MARVEKNVEGSIAGHHLKGDKCHHFRPMLDNWGIRRITCPDEIIGLRPWPCYRYEPEMDVDIYIMDSGILTTHEEFQEDGKSRAECSYAADDVGGVCIDESGHGTHVAGVAAGKVYGVAKKASAIGVKVVDFTGRMTVAGFLCGLQWIVDRVTGEKGNKRSSVINMSLRVPKENEAIDEAIKAALGENIPIVVAAGNDMGIDACLLSPARVGGDGGDAITVMASNMNDELASFSNCGTCTDIIAPGVCIRSADFKGDDRYEVLRGTSQAAPYVSGLVARYLAQNKGKTPAELKTWVTGQAAKDLIKIWANCKATTPNRLAQSDCYL